MNLTLLLCIFIITLNDRSLYNLVSSLLLLHFMYDSGGIMMSRTGKAEFI
jgi:hypothetical protein